MKERVFRIGRVTSSLWIAGDAMTQARLRHQASRVAVKLEVVVVLVDDSTGEELHRARPPRARRKTQPYEIPGRKGA